MKLVLLDAATLGSGVDLSVFSEFGKIQTYSATAPMQIRERIRDADILIVNKLHLGEAELKDTAVRLICETATGYDNIDTAFCKANGIAVCNICGYSTHSVAQVTLAMVLSLATHLPTYTQFVRDGSYTESGVANCLTPVYHELYGKTWGILGGGNIGMQVARVASAMGCRVLVHRRHAGGDFPCVDLETLCRSSDIFSIHVPLTEETKGMMNAERLAMMKPQAILVNLARGAVTDEAAVSEAIQQGRLGAFGTDVYSKEPLPKEHPLYSLKDRANVCLLPHMAWGAYEARVRAISEITENIRAFLRGEVRNRVEL